MLGKSLPLYEPPTRPPVIRWPSTIGSWPNECTPHHCLPTVALLPRRPPDRDAREGHHAVLLGNREGVAVLLDQPPPPPLPQQLLQRDSRSWMLVLPYRSCWGCWHKTIPRKAPAPTA